MRNNKSDGGDDTKHDNYQLYEKRGRTEWQHFRREMSEPIQVKCAVSFSV